MSSSQSRNPLYPEVILSNPDLPSTATSTSSMYPSGDTKDLENLFPDDEVVHGAAPREQLVLKFPGAIVNLIERENSVELACGDLSIVTLIQGDNVVAVFARVGDEIQWPLAKDEPVVKLDASHYFFTLRVPAEEGKETEDYLNYGLTIAAKGQEAVLKEFDMVLETYSCFSVQKVKEMGNLGVLDAGNVAPEEMEKKEKRKEMVVSSTAYWTTLAPNVDDYSGCVARAIAAGSGQLIRGILWCGDVTVDRLKWGNDFLSKRMKSSSNAEVSPATKRSIKSVKRLTKMSDKVATGILSGVVKVSGFFAGSIVNSKAGKKFFSLLPGEIVLASLDGFNKVCDAVEVAGKNVMNTTSTVTTGLVSQRYGEEAGRATNDGLGAAGHAIGTAWAVFKIRKALNPKSVMSPTAFAKAASRTKAEAKGKKKSK